MRNSSAQLTKKQQRRLKRKAKRNNVVPLYAQEQKQAKTSYAGSAKQINILPKTPNQDLLIQAIKTKELVFAKGYAGTGKTYCTMGIAAQKYKSKEIRKIILARPNVSTGPSLGAFPGDVNDKLWKWLAEPIDILKDLLGKGAPECMLKNGSLVLEPLEVIRGRSWDNAFILIDEAQNLTMDELKAITTRIGEGSTMVIAGDATQSDIRRGGSACKDFDVLTNLLQKEAEDNPDKFSDLTTGFDVIHLGEDDIVRSGIVRDLVRIYNKHNL